MSDLAKRFGSAPVVNMPSDERGWRIIGFKVPEIGELLCTPVDALRELRALALVREAAAALEAPTPSEQRAPAKPQDEAEMREVLAKEFRRRGGEIQFADELLSLRPGREVSTKTSISLAAMRTYAATERARARREAMEEAANHVYVIAMGFAAKAGDLHSNGDHEEGAKAARIGMALSDVAATLLSHPEAKAEDAPPDPLDRPVSDWRKVPVTAGMLCEAIQIAQNVPSGQIASATRFRRAVEAVATDALDRSASLHTGER